MVRRNRNSIRKERIIMLASSVLVLTALTVTGVFVKRNNNAEKEDYVVDFEAIEKSENMTAENMMTGEELDTLFAEVGTDDLDYDPSFQEANSQNVENTEGKLSSAKKESKKEKDDEEKSAKKTDKDADDTDKKLKQEEGTSQSQSKETDKNVADQEKSKKKEEESEEGMFDEADRKSVV